MITPNADFRPNPGRAIYIQGTIDQSLLQRLTPRIVSLQNRSRDPITVYIDSLGGSTLAADALRGLLAANNLDLAGSCRLITVATTTAASAAADLLIAGDYALAYPETRILYHGVRNNLDIALTAELASVLRESLKSTNDRYAVTLTHRASHRFIWRFVNVRSRFDQVRSKYENSTMSDLDCFLDIVSENISAPARRVLTSARERTERYNALVDRALKAIARSKRFQSAKRPADMEAVVIKAIVDFELVSNKSAQWTFEQVGLSQLTDDFFLLQEYFTNVESSEFKQHCLRWANFILTTDDQNELNDTSEEMRDDKIFEKVLPSLRPIWSFFVALCHVLQEGENDLTATDACWLGLIDEVIGSLEPLPLRYFMEFTPDVEPVQGELQTDEPEPDA